MKTKGRYSLTYHFKDASTEKITFEDENGKRKQNFSLTELDLLTMNFKDEEEFIEALNNLFGENHFHGGYLVIEYKVKGSTRRLNLCFNNQPNLKSLATENFGQSEITKDMKLTAYVNKIIEEYAINSDFIKEYMDKDYKDNHLLECLSYYISLEYSKDVEAKFDAKTRVLREVSHYKTFRNLSLAKRDFELKKKGLPTPPDRTYFPKWEIDALNKQVNKPAEIPAKAKKVKRRKKLDPTPGQMSLFDEKNQKEYKL